MHLNTSHTHNCALRHEQLCRMIAGHAPELPLLCWDCLGKWQGKQPWLGWKVAEHSLSSPSNFRGEGPAAQGLYIFYLGIYIFYTHFMLGAVGYCIVHKHTHTHLPNSRNKREKFAPSLTLGSKKDTDQQQLKTLSSLLSSDVQAAKPQSPHTDHPPAHEHQLTLETTATYNFISGYL